MTAPYEVDPTPTEVAVRCPACAARARFTFATAAYVESKELRERLADHPACESHVVVGWANNHQTVVVYYPGLGHPRPEGFQGRSLARGWDRGYSDEPSALEGQGVVGCSACGVARKHRLRWPDDAWFRCEVGGRILWAWTREHAAALRRFVASTERDRSSEPGFRFFLLRVPSHFLEAKRRDRVVAALDRLLA